VATRMFDRRPAGVEDPQTRAAAMVERHGARLLSIARQWSLCSDDAQDAFQRALEIYLRRAESLDPATELAWLKVVVIRTFVTPTLQRVRASRMGSDSPRQVGVERVAVVLRDAVTLFEGQPSPASPLPRAPQSRCVEWGSGIIIRVSGVRVPPPASERPANREFVGCTDTRNVFRVSGL
jgi:DNA-directed RNA polymerase specialized sigma24 family protein